MDTAAAEKLKGIRLLLLDVDGVLTDGSIIYNDRNEETKVFSVRDGLGIRLLMLAGIEVGIITGRASEALKHRCRNLGIDRLFDGVRDKAAVLEAIMADTGVAADKIAFVGDDLPDLSIMARVGLAVAVADAHEIVRSRADLVTRSPGGRGAVRELCESILKAQDRWEETLKRFDR